ncbi:MAG: hypothetical protein ABI336_09270 [Humibacillus sp.]
MYDVTGTALWCRQLSSMAVEVAALKSQGRVLGDAARAFLQLFSCTE